MAHWLRSARQAAEHRLADLFYSARRLKDGGVFARNVSVTFLVQVLSLFFAIANTAVIARLLGPEGKGLVALAMLVPGMLGQFLSVGIESANVYYAGSRRIDVRTLSANAMSFAILSSIVGLAVIGLLMATGWLEKLVPNVPPWLVALAIIEFPLRRVLSSLSSILQGLQRIVTVNLVNLSDYIWTLAFTLVLVVGLQLGVAGAVLASAAAVLVNICIVAVLIHREGGTLLPRWQPPVVRSTLGYGLRGYVGNVFQFFNLRLDSLLVNAFINPAGVGIYTTSVRVAELLFQLPNAVGFVLFPKAAATSARSMNRFTPRVLRVTLLLTTAGALGLLVLGKPLIVLIYGEAFASAYVPMLALLPGVVLLGGAKVLTNDIAGRGYPHYNSIATGISLIVTVALDLLLIPRLGILGASLASTASYSILFAIAIAFYLSVSRRAAPTLQDPKSGQAEPGDGESYA